MSYDWYIPVCTTYMTPCRIQRYDRYMTVVWQPMSRSYDCHIPVISLDPAQHLESSHHGWLREWWFLYILVYTSIYFYNLYILVYTCIYTLIHKINCIYMYILLPDFKTFSRQGHSFMMFQYHVIHNQCSAWHIVRNKMKKHSKLTVYTNFEKCYF